MNGATVAVCSQGVEKPSKASTSSHLQWLRTKNIIDPRSKPQYAMQKGVLV